MSSSSSDPIVEQNQRRILSTLDAHRIVFSQIDGALPENKEYRDNLFAISSQRGKYPQCFLKKDNNVRFIGLWPEIEVIYQIRLHLPTIILAQLWSRICWSVTAFLLTCWRPQIYLILDH